MRISRIISSLAQLHLVMLFALLCAAPTHAQTTCGNASNDCFTTNLFAGGCSNPVCCSLVCTVEPSCCDTAWDDVCVAIAEKYCSDCGLVKESCFQPHPTPSCNNGAICEFVCQSLGLEYCCSERWDEACVAMALLLTDDCGDQAAGSCVVVHENPNCRDAECCNTVCTIDPSCCATTWDSSCVNWAERFCFACGNPRAGSCCHSHEGPYCNDLACCEAVCAIDPFCCNTRWDYDCAGRANDPAVCNIPSCRCGDTTPVLGQNISCRAVHENPGCDDRRCCDEVCYFDNFCCEAEWDFACVQMAGARCALSPNPEINTICSNASGSCFVKHEGFGCSQASCCAKVCIADPTCCDVVWDTDCATKAAIYCNGCGAIDSGSCFFPHGTPSCMDTQCCEAVCAIDLTCCSSEWDMFCVTNAAAYCIDTAITCGDPRTRPCAVANYLPACSDEECCYTICFSFDPTCCSRAWDETCAANAVYACDIGINNCPASGSPLVIHGNPGCSDVLCCTAVCSLDPICCSFGWSEECVRVAKGVCVTFGECPGSGPCDASHANPGCEDATCCTIVCQADPVCCDVSWSSSCAQAARGLCVPQSSWPCPCVGSCFDAHPETAGCQDEVCCSGVCNIDPSCCTESWDAGCVSIARVTCCSFPGCGDTCTGDCMIPHQTPFCNDASCCEAVCRFEPYCCDVRWDSSCVLEALRTCVGGCGMPSSGNCFNAHERPGCASGLCCTAVCAAEEFEYCCAIEWDEECAARARRICSDDLPECGRDGLPGCNIPHAGPSCGDAACCDAVCKIDEYCCTNQWDTACVAMVYTTEGCERYQAECGGECAGACCEPHFGPWCNDAVCCDAVCLVDFYCCTTLWDAFCASVANVNPSCQTACPDPECGTPEAGACCYPHDNANCNDDTCCAAVCALDATCCDAVWDGVCASIANSECAVCEGGISCGSSTAGSCCNEHETEPYCNNAKCCVLVCSLDETCCIDGWDTTCVKLAQILCGCN